MAKSARPTGTKHTRRPPRSDDEARKRFAKERAEKHLRRIMRKLGDG